MSPAMHLDLTFMMHSRGLLLFILVLLGSARRSIRIAESHHDAHHQTNTFAEALKGSAEARGALLPWDLGKALFPLRGHKESGLPALRPQHGQSVRHLPQFSHNRSLVSPALRVGQHRATVALNAGGGSEGDQALPKEDLQASSWQARLDKAALDTDVAPQARIRLRHLVEDVRASYQRRALLSLLLSLGLGKEVWALPKEPAVGAEDPNRMRTQSEAYTPGPAIGAVQPAAPRSIGEPVVSGGRLPLTVGYGISKISPSETKRCVTEALDAGYRLFDTAQKYGNEADLGRAIKSAISSGNLKRNDVFLTTKVSIDNMGYSSTLDSVRKSADKLGNLDGGIDLVLVHWPGKFVRRDDPVEQERILNDTGNARLRKDTWAALEKLRRDGVVKQIGVSNFGGRHLKELLEYAKIKPAVNQLEVHPFNQQTRLVDLCNSEGISVEAYSPLGGKGNAGQVTDELLSNGLLKRIAVAHLKTVPEVILRWHLQRGITPIPKSSTPTRIQENFDVFDFELTLEEMAAIAKLDRAQFAIFDGDLLA